MDDHQFKLLEIDGYSERELAQADSIEELAEFLNEKSGKDGGGF